MMRRSWRGRISVPVMLSQSAGPLFPSGSHRRCSSNIGQSSSMCLLLVSRPAHAQGGAGCTGFLSHSVSSHLRRPIDLAACRGIDTVGGKGTRLCFRGFHVRSVSRLVTVLIDPSVVLVHLHGPIVRPCFVSLSAISFLVCLGAIGPLSQDPTRLTP